MPSVLGAFSGVGKMSSMGTINRLRGKTPNTVRRLKGPSVHRVSSQVIDFEWFFDRPHLSRYMTRAGRTYLSKGGMVIRREAQKGIKQMGKARFGGKAPAKFTKTGKVRQVYKEWIWQVKKTPPSPPGTPPHTHTGFLRRDIVYAYDPINQCTVIGPYRKRWLNTLHEFGGTVQRTLIQSKTVRNGKRLQWLARPGTRTPRWAHSVKSVSVTYPARPYMSTGIERARPKLHRLWLNSFINAN